MAKTAVVLKLKAALTAERRKNKRLRAVIDDLHEATRANKRELGIQFQRLAQLQAEVDALKADRRVLRVERHR